MDVQTALRSAAELAKLSKYQSLVQEQFAVILACMHEKNLLELAASKAKLRSLKVSETALQTQDQSGPG